MFDLSTSKLSKKKKKKRKGKIIITTIDNKNKNIMVQYNNSMNTPEEWKFDYDSIPVREGLIVVSCSCAD